MCCGRSAAPCTASSCSSRPVASGLTSIATRRSSGSSTCSSPGWGRPGHDVVMRAAAPVPVILDCDPGHDDMVAILLAAASPRIDLLAITVVGGNGQLARCVDNARAICTMAGIRDVPIAAGAPAPLTGRLRTAAFVHGESALDGAELGAPTVPVRDEH